MSDAMKWVGGVVRVNAGRLLVMVPGLGLLTNAATRPGTLSDTEFVVALLVGGGLLLGGYLAPSLRRLVIGAKGVEIETHEPNYEAPLQQGTELTEEVESTRGADVRPDEAILAAQFYAADRAMDSIFASVLHSEGLQFHLYLMDDDVGGLWPTFGAPNHVDEQPPWRPGVGVVGTAYQRNEFVVATGAATNDGTYGLDDTQRAQHAGLFAVAAAPIVNAAGTVIGVLAASERDYYGDGSLILQRPEAREAFTVAADACARVLIDLLGWFTDHQ